MKNLLTIFMTSVISVSAMSGQLIHWPGYIDNRVCLQRSNYGECGSETLGPLFKNGWGLFYSESNPLSGYLSTKWPEYLNGVDELKTEFWVKVGALDPSRKPNDWDGLPLMTSKGEPTNYWMKGFSRVNQSSKAIMTVRVHRCRWNNNSCVANLAPVDFKLTMDDFSNGTAKIPISFVDRERVNLVEAWMNNDISARLFLKDGPDALPNAVNARSLRMPSFMLYFTAEAFKNGIMQGSRVTGNIKLMTTEHVRLNHRTCSLTASPSTVQFGNVTVTRDQTGQVGSEVETKLTLSCLGEDKENLVIGGVLSNGRPNCTHCNDKAGQYNPNTTYVGNQVVHTVQRVYVQGSPQTDNPINGEPRIALRGFKGTDPQQLTSLYVEGNLMPGKKCGANGYIKLGENLNGFPGNIKHPTGESAIPNTDYPSIYWKLCKTADEVKAGDYTGAAKVNVEYR